MNKSNRYDDIIDLPYKKSKKHPPMPEEDRAAQFSPFAALKGYEDEIEEAARFVDGRVELDEARIFAINECLVQLKSEEKSNPLVSVKFFRPDERKEGGEFVTVSGRIKKVDGRRRLLVLEEESIPFDEIVEVERMSADEG